MTTLDLLLDLLRRPSITPEDAGCQAHIAQLLAANGFQVEHLNADGVTNLWATHGSGAPLICLAGHVDVVPPGPISAWRSPPFEPTERDGFLYARGASDMKGSVAAMTVALLRLASEGHDGTISLLLTSDEEGPGVAGTRHVLQVLGERGVEIDGALVGEPTSEKVFGDRVKSGRRGSLNGRLVVRGTQGHTAYPQLAENAVHRLLPALTTLVEQDWGSATADFPATTLQVSNIHAGAGASNVIPGEAEVMFNFRFGTNWTADELQARTESILRDHGILEPVEWNASAHPFLTQSGPLLPALTAAIHEVTGVEAKCSTGGGTSDARFFAQHGIPVAEFGPLNATIHAANENIEVACLEPLVEIYRRAVLHLLESAPS